MAFIYMYTFREYSTIFSPMHEYARARARARARIQARRFIILEISSSLVSYPPLNTTVRTTNVGRCALTRFTDLSEVEVSIHCDSGCDALLHPGRGNDIKILGNGRKVTLRASSTRVLYIRLR